MSNRNEPAYPVIDTDEHRQPYHSHAGLTKRELFAMAAMQGLLANAGFNGLSSDRTVEESVRCADRLLHELSKEQPK